MCSRKGFTLIEIIIVMVVLVVLMSIAILIGVGVKRNVYETSTKSNMVSLVETIKDFEEKNRPIPTDNNIDYVWSDVLNTTNKLGSIPNKKIDVAGIKHTVVTDSYGNNIRFVALVDGRFLRSAGKDGVFGTDDDIFSTNVGK